MSNIGRGWPLLLVWRGRLRQRWRAWLALAFLGAIGIALATTAATAARRTDSSYIRVLESYDTVDVASSHNLWPADAEAALADLAGNELVSFRHWVGFLPVFSPDLPAHWIVDVFGPWRGSITIQAIDLSAGRLPDPEASNEILIDDRTAEVAGLGVGDSLELHLLRLDRQGSEPRVLEIVGVGMPPLVAVIDDSSETGAVLTSAAFVADHRELMGWAATGFDLGDHDDLRGRASALLDPLGWPVSVVADEEIDRVSAALRPTIWALWIVATVSLAATTVGLVLALRREDEIWDQDAESLSAMGSRLSDRRRLSLFGAFAVLGSAAALGWVGALVASPLGPVGTLRRYEPDRGMAVDWVVTVVMVVSILIAVAAAARAPRRADEPSDRAARRLGAVGGLDVRLAWHLLGDAATASRRRLLAAVLIGSLAIGAATAGIVFVSSLRQLIDQPDLYGQTATVVGRDRFGDQIPAAIAEIADEAEVVGVATLLRSPLTIEGIAVPGIAIEQVSGDTQLRVIEGRPIDAPREIVMGAATAAQLGASIGDQIVVEPGNRGMGAIRPAATDQAQLEQATVTLVGTAVFPSIGTPGVENPRLDIGVAISSELFDEIFTGLDLPEWTLIELASGTDIESWIADHPEGIADLAQQPTDWLTRLRPAEVREAESVADLVLIGGIALAITIGAVLAVATGAVIRKQRHNLAVLHALGLASRSLGRIVYLQALVVTAATLCVGVPIGLALGRLSWVRFAESLGVVPSAQAWTPILFASLGAVAFLATVGGYAVGRSGTDPRPVLTLREQG